jgi:hypothetical protein
MSNDLLRPNNRQNDRPVKQPSVCKRRKEPQVTRPFALEVLNKLSCGLVSLLCI